MNLIEKIVTNGCDVLTDEYNMAWFPGDDLFAVCRPRGLPIGNLTSQFWSNCYLHSFDLFVKRELGCRAYLRYGMFCSHFALSRATCVEKNRAPRSSADSERHASASAFSVAANR